MKKINTTETIPIRFIIKEVNKKDYENYYSLLSDRYIPLWRKQTIKGFKTGARLLVKVADIGNWRKNYIAEFGGYKCLLCEDTGVIHSENGWKPCTCNFGELVRAKYYKKTRTIF